MQYEPFALVSFKLIQEYRKYPTDCGLKSRVGHVPLYVLLIRIALIYILNIVIIKVDCDQSNAQGVLTMKVILMDVFCLKNAFTWKNGGINEIE